MLRKPLLSSYDLERQRADFGDDPLALHARFQPAFPESGPSLRNRRGTPPHRRGFQPRPMPRDALAVEPHRDQAQRDDPSSPCVLARQPDFPANRLPALALTAHPHDPRVVGSSEASQVKVSSMRPIASGVGAIRGMRARSQPNASYTLRTIGGQVLK